MLLEYTPESLEKKKGHLHRIKSYLTQDYRSKESRQAFEELFRYTTDEDVCLSVGGGPERVHPSLTNLNIAPFPNVDVVGDAHSLPYGDETVDVIYCDAVIEHLSSPIQAVREMYRVLKLEGRAFVSTPFLQAYHGYPHHYQNFTLTGHMQLFTQQGFQLDASGTCVGPTWVIVNLVGTYIYTYFPRPFNVVLGKIWGLIGAVFRPLDKVLNHHKDSHIMASTTFLVARKPSL
jgi:SAM-dependent methyltransferase